MHQWNDRWHLLLKHVCCLKKETEQKACPSEKHTNANDRFKTCSYLSGLGYRHQNALTILSQLTLKVLLPSYWRTILKNLANSSFKYNSQQCQPRGWMSRSEMLLQRRPSGFHYLHPSLHQLWVYFYSLNTLIYFAKLIATAIKDGSNRSRGWQTMSSLFFSCKKNQVRAPSTLLFSVGRFCWWVHNRRVHHSSSPVIYP